MKKIFLLLIVLISSGKLFSQNGATINSFTVPKDILVTKAEILENMQYPTKGQQLSLFHFGRIGERSISMDTLYRAMPDTVIVKANTRITFITMSETAQGEGLKKVIETLSKDQATSTDPMQRVWISLAISYKLMTMDEQLDTIQQKVYNNLTRAGINLFVFPTQVNQKTEIVMLENQKATYVNTWVQFANYMSPYQWIGDGKTENKFFFVN